MGEPIFPREFVVAVKVRIDEEDPNHCSCSCRWNTFDGWCDLFDKVLDLDKGYMGARAKSFLRCDECKTYGDGRPTRPQEIDKIIIDNGETFEGTPEQFKDCFFDNVNIDNIQAWCKKQDSTYEIIFSNGEKING